MDFVNSDFSKIKYFNDWNWDFEILCNHHNTPASIYLAKNITKGTNAILKVEKGNNTKLHREVDYFLRNTKLKLFPRIYSYGEYGTKNYYCLMEYLDTSFLCFSELFYKNQLTTDHLSFLLSAINEIPLHSSMDISLVTEIYQIYYKDRLYNRLALLKNSSLCSLLQEKHIVINENEFMNIINFWIFFMQKLNNPFFDTLGPYPGDLHFEHIYINSHSEIKIIDPNGAIYLPLIYDLGKMLHSLHGGYDIFVGQNFFLKENKNNTYNLHYNFPINRQQLLDYFEEAIVKYWGEQILYAAYLSEIFHYSSLIAHHTSVRKEALGLYLRTIELLEEFKGRFL